MWMESENEWKSVDLMVWLIWEWEKGGLCVFFCLQVINACLFELRIAIGSAEVIPECFWRRVVLEEKIDFNFAWDWFVSLLGVNAGGCMVVFIGWIR